jgi:hypothetical protein
MKKWIFFITVAAFWACNGKKGKTGEIVETSDFIDLFPSQKLPFIIQDSTVRRLGGDTATIKYKDVIRFVPDSLIEKDFRKAKPIFYPLAKLENKTDAGTEIYLFSKAVYNNRRVIYLTVFFDDNYAAGKTMLSTLSDAASFQTTGLERGFTISTMRLYRTVNGETIYKKEAYIFNREVADFTLILTESNDESLSRLEEVLNPLDTFSGKNEYSGDYLKDKMNIVSFRDGKNQKEYNFFVHFEKDKGECVGELKGIATFVSPNLAVYGESGNPCVLHFNFKGNSVTLKEEKGCGSYRDIKCFFEGSFTRKKQTKVKETKPSKSQKSKKRNRG